PSRISLWSLSSPRAWRRNPIRGERTMPRQPQPVRRCGGAPGIWNLLDNSSPTRLFIGLDPSELLHGQSSMPDLRHVPDLLTVKIHHIHIVRLHTLARWWARATLASMSAREDAVCTDALPLIISAKGLEFISSVRHK